ncbi:MAG: UDP-3-O-[3-hydroxymyristoyl] N-acetylglucosamine deacetylase [Alphaproteobacteria bacterium CG11_big_fil_rev_8_21_14_0_20_39_49]|nr:MAG: UDP-3-O-[3-hydroxymyristoyl] N-acetylglucosamine deacetylase [Alphaproteobacteria bacterium CG11_big_fil_rev_8_21_14_0_20_39_49]
MFSYQKTLANKVSCVGVGLHSGVKTSLVLNPASEDTGILFIRTDVKGKDNVVEASYKNVSNTMLGTTLCNKDGVRVATVEHLMAALWGCGIDNCVIEIDAPEVPIMDGSSEPFVFLVDCAGVKEQSKTRKVIEVLKEIRVTESDKADSGYISIAPAEGFSVGLEIDFGDKVISNQKAVFDSRDVTFKGELCRARTFCFEQEVDLMRKNGLARGGSLDNAIVVNEGGVINKDGLRYSNEFVRHKVLDCIGDIYLAGAYLKGHLSGFKSGHGLNNKLLHEFFADEDAWRVVQLPEGESASMLQHKLN